MFKSVFRRIRVALENANSQLQAQAEGVLNSSATLPLRRIFFLFALFVPLSAQAAVDLVINTTDNPDPVLAGGVVTYTVEVDNNGSTGATGLTSSHSIPANTTYLGFSGTGVTCTGMTAGTTGPGVLNCSLPNVAGLAEGPAYTVQLRTSAQGSIVFGATVSSIEPDATGANNTDNEQTTVSRGANFSISKTPASGNAISGATFSWQLTVNNAGPDAASNLRVQDPIPTGFSVTSLPAGCSNNAGTIVCNISGPIAPGASFVIGNVAGVITAGGGSTVTNVATVALSPSADPTDPDDPDTTNNTAVSNISINPGSDVRISKTRSVAGNFLVGDSFNFILSPTYTGDSPNGLTISDTIPSNYTIGALQASQNGWSCGAAGQVVTCSKASGGGSAGSNQPLGNIVIPVTVATAGNGVINSAAISTTSNDPDSSNNTTTDGGVNLLAPTVDLGVTKTGPSPALVVAGVPFNFNIRATNTGTASYFGTITLTDNLPAGMTVTSYAATNGWTCSALPVTGPASITCQRTYTSGSQLAGGANTPVVTLTAQVATSGSFNNSVGISADCNLGPGNCGDGDTANYAVTSSVGTDAADISIDKRVDLANVPAGDVLTYTLEVINAGPQPSSTVVLTDTFGTLINNTVGATGAGYVGHTINPGVATGGSCSTVTSGSNGRRITCNFTTIPVCTAGSNCPTVVVQVRPGGDGGPRSNTANVVSNGTADPNHSNETDTANNTVDPRADVTVTKNVNPGTVPAGQNLTYVVAAANAGPSRADNVTITDTLPLDVTFVSATPSSGSCSVTPGANVTTTAGARTVTCNLGSVNSGSQSTVNIVIRPNTGTRGTTITNDVAVSTSTTETNNTNNTATVNASVSVPSLDLVINKSDSVDPLAVGDSTVYTITVNNQGPSAAENVVVTDTLPATGLSFQSATPSAGSCPTQPAVNAVGGTIICNLGYIPASSSRTISVNMTATAKGVVTNGVSVSSNETGLGFETTGNNSVNETTTIRSKADMQVVSKVPSASPVNLRQNFNFTVKVRNNIGAGLAEADDVVVSDTLPSGMQLTGTPTVVLVAGSTTLSTCTGSAGSTSFTCNLGTVSIGGEVDIAVPVRVVTVTSSGQSFSNTATVVTTSLDTNGGSNPSAGNNFNSGNVTVNSSSIAGRVFRDFNNSGTVDGDDNGIAGITMTLSGTAFDGTPISITTGVVTDANGNYQFTGLPQGTYQVAEGPVADTSLIDGTDTAGSVGGTVTNDLISAISLPANTAAIGYLFAERPVPKIGLAKSAGAVVNNGDGTYTVQFTLTVTNVGATPLTNVQINDTIDIGGPLSLGTYTTDAIPAAGQYTIVGAPVVGAQTNGASLSPVAAGAFTGTGAGTGLLVSASSSLPDFTSGSRSSATVSFTVRFFPTTPGPFQNTATTNGTAPDGVVVNDNSQDGTNVDPDNDGDPTNNSTPTQINLSGQTIGIAKRLGSVVQTGAKRYTLPYTLVVANPGTVTATNVQVTDNLALTFPTAQSITIAVPAAVTACTGTVLTVSGTPYNGTSQLNLLTGNQNLQPGERCTITFTAEVDFGSNALPSTVQNNQAIVTTAQTPGGTVIATDSSNDGTNFDPNNNGNANEPGENEPTPVSFAAGNLASVSGKVWRDLDHDRIQDTSEPLVNGFIVEAVNAAGQIVGSTVTDENGAYTIGGLYPSTPGNPTTYYSVRFRDPVSRNIYGRPASQDDPASPRGTNTPGAITQLQLAPGENIPEQNLPLDPSGVVYNAVTRTPVSGAVVTITGPAGFNPAVHLVGGSATAITGADGLYQFLLHQGAPDGTYTLSVTTYPPGFVPAPSSLIPVCQASLTVNNLPDPARVQLSNSAPSAGAAIHDPASCPNSTAAFNGANQTSTQYFFNLVITANGGFPSANLLNNHIPLDPILGGALVVTKTTPLVNVSKGDLVPYSISVTNNLSAALPGIDVVDRIPPGFKYRSGSANLNGNSLEPTVTGRDLTWKNQSFAPNERKLYKLMLVVGTGVSEGEYVNQAWGNNSILGALVSNIASAAVRITPDPTFDCSDIIGKVFDDKNANGYQDEGEPGLPNVRVVTVRGLLFTSDPEGRFHIACADIPDSDRGSNFVMKLDERTLPSGYRMTTENPRDVRTTRGKLVKLNFGATIHRVVRLDLNPKAFAEGENTLLPEWEEALPKLRERLAERPSILRLAYDPGGGDPELGQRRLDAVAEAMRKIWKQHADEQKEEPAYPLVIETAVEGQP
ncbi:MAG TPA: SdrD B-like domain-containing protein [Methylophilaceae bacterium]|nr:SdrD B-like domain-containing protein [Methylophilaceae bacterium]